jgi:hypothetical protein
MTAIKHITTEMFSFLNNGDINNIIRGITTNLPGLTTSDSDKIKYAALNYATAMRHNLHNGVPIFTHIRTRDAEIEKQHVEQERRQQPHSTTAATPTAATTATQRGGSSLFPDNDIHRDNATLALIMAKELAFLNRSIQFVSLIASRYQEEQEDLEWGRNTTAGNGNSNGDIEEGGCCPVYDDDTPPSSSSSCFDVEDDSTPSVAIYPLQRSRSSSFTATTATATATATANRDYRPPQNQLVATYLIAIGRLNSGFYNLCSHLQTQLGVVHAMTTQDTPHSPATVEKQLMAEQRVISDIFAFFEKCDTEHREPVVKSFVELRDISVSVWRIMSMFAFSNLFRLAEGTDFAIYNHQPENAIFTQGRDYKISS